MTDDELKALAENVAKRALLKAIFKAFDALLMKQYRSIIMAELTHATALRLKKHCLESAIYDLVAVFEAENDISVTSVNISRNEIIDGVPSQLAGIDIEVEL